MRAVVLCVIAAFALAGQASAQEKDESVVYQKKTFYNFEDDVITGDLTRPDQEFLTGRKEARQKSLIRVREDFRDKVLKSVKDL